MAEIKIQLRHFASGASSSSYIVGDLDVTSSEDFPLSLTMQNFDIRDINSRSGSFSKTFDIPATNNNNRILRELHAQGFNTNLHSGVISKIDSVIYADNVPIIAGKLRVTSVTKSDTPVSYSCEFVGDNMDWASSIKNLELKDLRFTSISGLDNAPYVYDNCRHVRPETVNDNTTTNSFVENQIGNDFHHFTSAHDRILWPLLSVGEGLSDRNQVTLGDFVPAFYIKNIWDKIFENQGYTVESTFCNSAYFKSLIMPFEFEKRAEQVNNKFGKITLNFSEDLSGSHGSLPNNVNTPHHLDAYFDGGANNQSPTFMIGRSQGHINTGDGTATAGRYDYDTTGNWSGAYGRFLFGGGEIIDDYDGVLSTTSGNVQMGTSQNQTSNSNALVNAYAGTMLCINEPGDHELDFSIKAQFARNSETVPNPNSNHLAYTARLEIWEVADDFGSGIYETAANIIGNSSTSNPQYTRLWNKSYTVYTDSPAESTKTWSPSTPIQVSGVGKKFIACLEMRTNLSDDGNSVNFGFLAPSYFQISGKADMSIGEDITDPHFFLPDGKQSDFVMGIAQMYNLQFHTDPIAKKVFVEPYDFFYESQKKAYDWSDKIDLSKNTKETFPHELKSEIRVKYKDASSDAFLERFNARNLIDWGEYKEINTSGVFQDGVYTVENKFFSPTFNWYEPEYVDSDVGHDKNDAPLIPIYHRDYSFLMAARFADRADKNFQIGARILLAAPLYTGGQITRYESALTGEHTQYSYNNNEELAPSNAEKSYFTRANFITFDNIGDPDGASNRFRLEYSMGAYDDPKAFNVPLNTHIMLDPNLSFNDVVYFHDEGGDFADGYTAATNASTTHRLRGLFYNFYNRMFKQLKARPRIRTTYFKLNYDDILRIDFRRLVYLDGVYYRINKIIDYKPHRTESTKVELMEFFDLGKDDVLDGDMMDLTNGLNI